MREHAREILGDVFRIDPDGTHRSVLSSALALALSHAASHSGCMALPRAPLIVSRGLDYSRKRDPGVTNRVVGGTHLSVITAKEGRQATTRTAPKERAAHRSILAGRSAPLPGSHERLTLIGETP
jgi:hypothetical protein